jgi:hypothetical protein
VLLSIVRQETPAPTREGSILPAFAVEAAG